MRFVTKVFVETDTHTHTHTHTLNAAFGHSNEMFVKQSLLLP